MSLKVEKLEKNMAELKITLSAEEFEKAVEKSFQKNRNRFNIPGFRKGKATRALVEKFYGAGALYEDAVDFAIDASYPDAAKESKLDIVSRPEIGIEQLEKGKDFVYTAKVAVRPEVTLGEYKGVEVKKADTSVSREELEEALRKEQEKNARLIVVEDRAVQSGDNTLIDFDGKVDGVRFEGGKGEDYPLVIGSNSFIAGFEDQLIGHKLGEEFDIDVTFPEEYHAKDLAGKPAVFMVKIKEIKEKELPKLDDEFAGEVSEFDTLEEFKADLEKKLQESKQKKATTENENAIVQKVVDNAKMEIPDPMIEMQLDRMVQDYAGRMQAQGINLEQYMQYTGMTMEKLREQMREQAQKNIRTGLVLEAVAKTEDIQVSEERVEEELQRMAENYKMEVEKLKEYFRDAQLDKLKNELRIQEAVDFLVAEARLV